MQRLRRHAKRMDAAASARADDRRPFALVETADNAQVLIATDAAAQNAGVRAGLALSDARAICPGLVVRPVDRGADGRALRELAAWARRFTPWTALEGRDALALDITGCARLFGGEEALCARLRAALRAAGLTARLGLADTRLAAAALARWGTSARAPVRIAPAGETASALGPLPIAALGVEPGAARKAALMGLTDIAALAAMPRTALAKRFRGAPEQRALEALDIALGTRPAPFSPLLPPPLYAARREASEPLLTTQALQAGLTRLAQDLADALQADDHGARALRLSVLRADASAARLQARLAKASADPAHFERLFAERLGAVDPGFGVDMMTLEAVRTQRLDHAQAACSTLLRTPQTREDAAAALIDRLAARFGGNAVRRLAPGNSWLPERSDRMAPAEADAPDWSTAAPASPLPVRPIRVFDPPEPIVALAALPDAPPARFTWRRRARRILRAQGPERIAPEWWRDPGARPRDYYVVEDAEGRRYWLFREGLYEGETDPDRPPAWFIHGAFA